MKTKIAVAAFALSAAVSSAVAGPAEKIGSWFTDQNYANVTAPGVFEGQGSRMVALGGVSTRAPITQPFEFASIQTPRFSAGCGGIDVHMGGFTMVDGDAFVENLRAIGQNAQGLAFMLAIQAVSPMLSGAMEFIEEIQKELNKFNMDSCEAASQLVGGALEYFDREKANCIAERRKTTGEDFAKASEWCTTRGGKKPTENEVDFIEGNLTWYVLMQDPFFKNDTAWSELMMNIVGTVIITRTDNSSDSAKVRTVLPPAIQNEVFTERYKNIMAAILHGRKASSGLYIQGCEGGTTNSPSGCQQISAVPKPVTVNWDGIYDRVKNLLTSIYGKIKSDTALTNQEAGLIAATRLPVYRYLSAASTYYPGWVDMSSFGGTDYAALIAEDIINNAISAVLDRIETNMKSPPKGMGESKEFKEYAKVMDKVRTGVALQMQNGSDRAGELESMMNNIARYEKALLPKIGGEIASAALWGTE